MPSIEERRDINNLFKFKVGDVVKKAWRWSRHQRDRFGPQGHIPMGSIGTIKEIRENGTIVVSFHGRGMAWSLGASELDFAPPDTILPSDTVAPISEFSSPPGSCMAFCPQDNSVCECTCSNHIHDGEAAVYHHHYHPSESHKW